MTRTATRDFFKPGTRVGDYTIERVLRREELAVVYAGVHLVLPRRAELKVMHADIGRTSGAVQILREACILEALSHLGVPRVYECGLLSERRPWVAVEAIDGATLRENMVRGPIAVSELVGVLRDLAGILVHAHDKGVCHNALSEDVVVHTPARPFPLCIRSWTEAVAQDSARAVDPSSDIEALGALAFRALTGAAPAPGTSAQQQCPSAPAELAHLIDDMLEPDPAERPRAEVVRERARWLAETLELVPGRSTRWTPKHGMSPVRRAGTVDGELHVRIK
jgi:serine/threonine protein kinase